MHKIRQQVEKNTSADPDEIAEVTPKVIDDMSNEYGQLSEEDRSMEALIPYLYSKYMKKLGLLE